MIDPLKVGFHYVEYEYMNRKMRAVYFQLESAQEAMMKMLKRGVKCTGLHEWTPKPEILKINKQNKS
jgi:hypothetical protein